MNGAIELPLSNGGSFLVDEPFEYLSRWRWRKDRYGYARRDSWREGKRITIVVHRLVLDAQPGQIVDHINGLRTDNRRCNLRLCDAIGNSRNVRSANQNSGRYKGVYQPKKTWRWCSAIAIGEKKPNGKRKRIHLGTFDTPEEAARAYDKAALEHFGPFAYLNFPDNDAQDFAMAMGEAAADGQRGAVGLFAQEAGSR